MVGELLTKADAGTSIERNENEGIFAEVLLMTFIEEAFWIKLKGCHVVLSVTGVVVHSIHNIPSGPHRSFLLCNIMTL